MGWFNFFSKKNGTDIRNAANESLAKNMNPDIPGELFPDGDFKLQQGSLSANNPGNGMEQIYNFLQADYESKGYGDALVNPDNSYKTDNIRLMQLDLKILIDKTNTYYENLYPIFLDIKFFLFKPGHFQQQISYRHKHPN